MKVRLREVREASGMTQEMLAEKSGISRQTISTIENGKAKTVMSSTMLSLAGALGTTIDAIFFTEAV